MLLSLEDGSIPIQIKFSDYHEPMMDCDNMRVSAVVADKEVPPNLYLAENDVVLLDPPITVNVSDKSSVSRTMTSIFVRPPVPLFTVKV